MPRKKEKTRKGDRFLENSHSALHQKRDETVWDLDTVKLDEGKQETARREADVGHLSGVLIPLLHCHLAQDTDSSRDG